MTEPTAADRERAREIADLALCYDSETHEETVDRITAVLAKARFEGERTEASRMRRRAEAAYGRAFDSARSNDDLRAHLAQSTSRSARLESAIQEVDAMLSRPDWPSWMRVLELTALMARLHDELGVPS